MHLLKIINDGIEVIKKEGFNSFLKKLYLYIFSNNSFYNYSRYNSDYQFFLETVPKNNNYINKSSDPLIFVVIATYNTPLIYLNECISSVLSQTYQNWELCIYDDASTNNETIKTLFEYEKKDSRIKIIFGKENHHISYAFNQAISSTKGKYVCFLDHDDILSPIALSEIFLLSKNHPNADFIYTDEDLLSPEGKFIYPRFKPDFNMDLLYSHNYITHFVAIRKTLGDSIAWFREGYEGAQDYDLFLRISSLTKNIYHIPKVLYHWRQSVNSTASNYKNKNYAISAGKRALESILQDSRIQVEPIKLLPFFYRIIRPVSNSMVTIIIPFRDKINLLKECINSIIEKTNYTNYEILLVDNQSIEKATIEYLSNLPAKCKLLKYNYEFNFSAICNFAVQHSCSEYILLLNNDTKVISPEWLYEMVSQIEREDVGVVGAKLLYKNNRIQHAGIILGVGGVGFHSHITLSDHHPGYYNRAAIVSNVSAVTGACLLTKKSLYNLVGGLDEQLAVAFNDIDFCLKIRELGKLIVYTPFAKLYHYESMSRGYEVFDKQKKRFAIETDYIKDKWKDKITYDPYYNCNFSRDFLNFKL